MPPLLSHILDPRTKTINRVIQMSALCEVVCKVEGREREKKIGEQREKEGGGERDRQRYREIEKKERKRVRIERRKCVCE